MERIGGEWISGEWQIDTTNARSVAATGLARKTPYAVLAKTMRNQEVPKMAMEHTFNLVISNDMHERLKEIVSKNRTLYPSMATYIRVAVKEKLGIVDERGNQLHRALSNLLKAIEEVQKSIKSKEEN
jgi:hypothetical protein